MMCILLIIQKVNNTYILIFQFYNLYKTRGIGIIIFVFFFTFTFLGFLTGLLESLILDKLTPNYVIIGIELGKVPHELLSIKDAKFWPIIFIIILQALCLLFYLEIFEFNFCSLNKNTKKSILKRQSQLIYDENDDNDDNENIENEIDSEYSIYSLNDTKEIEMNETIDENENKNKEDN